MAAGMVFVIHPMMIMAELPFGGIRSSGFVFELAGLGIMLVVNH